ncbi:MAG: oligogalacturonate lyase family protein, partial [Verrucomicrobia bacterium]|nr:oligogalacturonate lyase family protein [Verrucomicrobiota bacterium]
TDPNLLYFDLDLPPAYWNGSDGKTPRIWILDISSRNTRPLKKSFPGPFQTHTSWLWDGSALAYHGPLPGGGIYLGITTPDGQTRWEQSFPKARNYGHVAADPSRPALILDGDFSTDRLQWLYYDKPNDGTPRLEPICRHQTEWKSIPGQYSHPHPLADPTGHWIAFNAARRGRSDVFVVDITEKR